MTDKTKPIWERYEKLKELGRGTYGVVYRAFSKELNRDVAIKKVVLGSERATGVNFSVIRELNILNELHHENVVGLLETLAHEKNIYLVMECMESDLTKCITNPRIMFTPGDIKGYMLQLLQGLQFMHERKVMHRDLKPDNLLISTEGVLKIADFGLSRSFAGKHILMTPTIATPNFRPPENMWGCTHYGPATDMWAVGAIFAHLLRREYLFLAETEPDLLEVMASILPPMDDEFKAKARETYPAFLEPTSVQSQTFRSMFPAAPNSVLDMLHGLLTWDPDKRWTAEQCLNSAYMTEAPAPTPPSKLPRGEMTGTARAVEESAVPRLPVKRKFKFSMEEFKRAQE
ncbi:Protein kinase domain [Carpediemonas membranifera]|uniref:[RNA-polymerase]-subunit kinase n=1 Tax=Carpediemonas membranifera TaxID=201153 RepID=A0A8J6AY03_9EUKA|nr:Protein kinase domain [Carpediemonas membranifera]|eukprot:KAG9396898.1 Protein kinase domain [Carpediemonas membranifera]